MSDPRNLARFVQAQAGVYRQALAELRAGEKQSHWMWFIFPQITGLGHSHTARLYAIAGRGEGEAYLAHELLGSRLRECTEVMLGWAGKRSAHEVLGPIDALKFASSMTLFEACAQAPGETSVTVDEALFGRALDEFYLGQRDRATWERL